MTLTRAAAVLLAVLFVGTSTAQADVIDFRDGVWGPGGANTETNGGVTVEALPCVFSACPTLNWSSDDGFGVDSGFIDREDDEVNNYEALRVSFAGGAYLSGFLLSDLFYENGASERAYYSLDGSAWTMVSAPVTNLPGSTNGLFQVNFAPIFVNSITFGFPGLNLFDRRNDFAVAAVTVNAVPEPATLLLFTTGLAGALLARRRQTTA
jgi:PEP-CTERM motif